MKFVDLVNSANDLLVWTVQKSKITIKKKKKKKKKKRRKNVKTHSNFPRKISTA